ncbi:non-ribosomal peptide synthetase [Roseateles chitinivorans]|uniref:non-ribosomal peptide synthetase n=1 Tax=Roseateles chitinivorans TaxID=2917965 RepID=UPI003D66FBB5
MNAIHTPGLPAETIVGTGLSPEQRIVAGPLDAASIDVAQLGAVPGLTASVMIDVGLDGGPHGGADSSRDASVDSSPAGATAGESLRRAVAQAIDAHEILRTAFGPVEGYRGLRQWPLPRRPALDWSSVDLRDRDEAALQAWIDQLSTPLSIAEGQVLRAGIARVSDTRHVLALHASALVADEGSLRALLAQIAQAHAERHATTAGFDVEELFQYSQYVEWRAELAGGEDGRTGAAYWRAHLAGDTAWHGPRLPSPLAPRAGRVEARTVLDAGLARRIASFRIGDAGIGAEPLLHAVWLLLLARLNGFERFIAGWRHDCRDDYEVMRGAFGVFEKLLPVAVTLSGETRVDDWLSQVAATTGAHVDAQEYWTAESPTMSATDPAKVAAGVGAAATTAHQETIFHWQTVAAPASGWSAPAIVRSGADSLTDAGALALAVCWGEAAELVLHADGQRHSQTAVERLLEQFTTLVTQVLDRPQAAVRELDPVGPVERAALLRAGEGERRHAGALTVSQHVAEWAALSPQAPALEAGGVVLDYRALNQRANRLARAMTSLGVAPGSLVALDLPRGADLIVAMLAAWRAGAAYLPLEPGWPAARRRALLADARPALVLSASSPRGDGDGDGDGDEVASALLTGDVITPAGRPGIDLRQLDGTQPATQPRLEDLAYVLYTSGSTGHPKGVAIEHGQLLNYVVASTVAMDLAASRRWGLTSSVVADLGNTALFGALFNGACLVIANDDDTRSPAAFARFVETMRIDAVKIVPSHLEALLEDDAARVPRTLVLGGEAAPRALIERLRRLAPDTVIHNHYGPTETTVGVLVHRVRASDLQGGDALPLTQALANNRVLVLDEAMRLAPAGGLGQVFIGGSQVCRGYLGREVQGAFIDDPFHPGERLYRTGDVARVLAEGGLRLVGRADHQVKVRGFRVDPAEIEVALLALPGVRQAVVLAEPGATGEIELSACVVLESDGGSAATAGTAATGGAGAATATDRPSQSDGPDRAAQSEPVERIRESLKAALPSHMVPTRFHAFDVFPRLANGKLDRGAIVVRMAAEAATAVAASSTSATGGIGNAPGAPRDALEVVLAQGMGLLLGRGPIGIDEDFFELGGHSLMVIRLVARLRKLLGIEIEPGLVFDHPTVAELAAALRAGPWDTSGFERLAATDWHKAEKTAEKTP